MFVQQGHSSSRCRNWVVSCMLLVGSGGNGHGDAA